MEFRELPTKRPPIDITHPEDPADVAEVLAALYDLEARGMVIIDDRIATTVTPTALSGFIAATDVPRDH